MFDFDTLPDRRGTSSQKWDHSFGEDVTPLSVADADFAPPRFIADAIAERVRGGVFGYTYWPDKARRLTTAWLKDRHEWSVPEADISLCGGVLTGLVATLRAALTVGDGVVINSPIYAPFAFLLKANGFEVHDSPLVNKSGYYSFDWSDLEKKLRAPSVKCLILCNPHNPVGRVYTVAELTKLSQLCLRHGVLVVSDEIHADLILSGHRHTPIASLNTEQALRTVTLLSPSKTFNIAGLPGAAIVCADHALQQTIDLNVKAMGGYLPGPLTTVAYQAAYRDGHAYVGSLLAYIEENVTLTRKYFASACPAISVGPSEGTYLLWLDCRKLRLSDEDLQSLLLEKARVIGVPGGSFGNTGLGFLRLNVACPRHVLSEALTRIARALTTVVAPVNI